MSRVTLFDKSFKTLIPYREIEAAIDRVAEAINKDYAGCTDIPVLLCVLNGSILFTAELMKRLDFQCEIVSIKLSSYHGTKSTGKINVDMGLTSSVKGRRVIVIEDIVDTGATISALKGILEEKGAVESKICTLLFKPDVYKKDIKLDYVALEIPNDFIVGFGLDYEQIGRNSRDILVLDDGAAEEEGSAENSE